jgi:hemerythrin-like domain-containing protein
MQTITTLTDEHNGVLTVLGALEQATTAAECGVAVPVDIFTDIEEFFAVFVDRCHHTKEEQILFPALSAAGALLQRRLEHEQEEGRGLVRAYAAAVQLYHPGDALSGLVLGAAADNYGAFLRRHIALETAELFPLIARTLSAEADAAAVAAFERIEEEQIGPGTHERLHGMIASLEPRIAATEPHSVPSAG